MPRSSMLHVRIDDELKVRASEALASMGLSVSDAVRILLTRVVSDRAFPLELRVPTEETRAAMREAAAIIASRSARFASGEVLIEGLESAGPAAED